MGSTVQRMDFSGRMYWVLIPMCMRAGGPGGLKVFTRQRSTTKKQPNTGNGKRMFDNVKNDNYINLIIQGDGWQKYSGKIFLRYFI